MAFDWNNYLEIAKKLQGATRGKEQNGNNEALQRIAVSRAYYAIYHFALEYAEDNLDYSKPSTDQHTALRFHYSTDMSNYKHAKVGKILLNLHSARKKCDYEADDIGNIEKLLENSLLQADDIKQNLTT